MSLVVRLHLYSYEKIIIQVNTFHLGICKRIAKWIYVRRRIEIQVIITPQYISE